MRSSGSLPHTHTGKSGGQVQPFARSWRNRLTIRSSSEWNEITARRPPGRSICERGRERCLERAELVVDGDAESLEDALGRMALTETRRCRDRRLDRVDELARARERALGAPADDGAGDRAA